MRKSNKNKKGHKKTIFYKKYIRSAKWKKKRLSALKRAKNSCQLCNSKNKLHVHHRTYKNLGNELLSDLTVLCRTCHNMFHKYRKLENSIKKSQSK